MTIGDPRASGLPAVVSALGEASAGLAAGLGDNQYLVSLLAVGPAHADQRPSREVRLAIATVPRHGAVADLVDQLERAAIGDLLVISTTPATGNPRHGTA